MATLISVQGNRAPDATAAGAPYDGQRFGNLAPFAEHSLLGIFKWMLDRQPGIWHDRTTLPPGLAPPERVTAGEVRVTHIGHATVLVQIDGVNVLTDPVFSDRVGPVSWLGTRRQRSVGLRFDDLPPIDAVLISHNHYDHLDLPSLVRLNAKHHPRFFVGLKNAPLLSRAGIERVQELDWWQHAELASGVEVTGVPAQHWSKRSIGDDFTTLWLGFVLRGSGGSVYFAGDTGWGPHFEQIADRLGPTRVALLPIGAFRPRWFMARAHLAPSDAMDAALVLQAELTIPMHFGTFRLGDDGQDEPLAAMKKYLETMAEPKPKVVTLDFGESLSLAPQLAVPRPAATTN